MLRRVLLSSAVALATSACSDRPTAVEPVSPPDVQAAKFVSGERNAPVYWNAVARGLVGTYRFNALQATRGYAMLSVAQYNAAIAAEKLGGRGHRQSVHAAVSAASVVVLSYLHPAETSALESRLEQYLAGEAAPNERYPTPESAVAIGRAVGAQMVARAEGDGFFATWTGTVPTGPGKWFSATTPVGAMVGKAKTYLLTSGSQFRPAPPPAFDSPAFNAALAEIRRIADTRTPEQRDIAVFWNLPAGTHQPPGYWNELASQLAVKRRLSERETAHTMALMNMVSYDALVASHEAKFFYWLIRPSQADPGIVLPIGLPNFPSYPSNHAALSAGMARVLAARFPSERARLEGLAEEAAMSRIYGGIHYRFDGEAGLALGRTVAAWALAHDVKNHEPFVLR